MAKNKGKQFEQKFKEDFLKIKDATIDRLYDPVGGMRGISNISDFIGYIYPKIYYLECKSHEGNTFPFSCLSQYDKLIHKVGIKGVRVGVILWMIDHNKVVYIPISTITKMKEDNKKSFHINMLETKEYNVKEIPSKKLRTFMDSDYLILKDLQEGE